MFPQDRTSFLLFVTLPAEDSALRLAKELDLELTSAEAAVRDLSEGFGPFYFLTQAFLPQYLYWEACDMLRKLALVGLVLLAGRGSTAQIAAALTLSFIFFAVHMKTWPYKIEADNVFRAATEIHIFIVICIAVILKTDLESETLQAKFYVRRPFECNLLFAIVSILLILRVWSAGQVVVVLLHRSTADIFHPHSCTQAALCDGKPETTRWRCHDLKQNCSSPCVWPPPTGSCLK